MARVYSEKAWAGKPSQNKKRTAPKEGKGKGGDQGKEKEKQEQEGEGE